jgi:nucleoside-diphosphate-sugar epimerase
MHINVIGGSGFIGTVLCKRFFEKKMSFSIIDKAQSISFPTKVVIGDVRSVQDLDRCLLSNSILINLAAEHRDDVTPRTLYDEVNVEGAKNICQVAIRKNINTIIFTSSVAVYGFCDKETDENGTINPFNDYGRTKYEAELVYKEWQSEDPLSRKLVIIRPTVVFGEGNKGNVYNLFKQIYLNKFIMIGRGENKKSIAYVENIAAFIYFAMNIDSQFTIVNYVDKPDYKMNELVIKINRELNRKIKTNRFYMPYVIGVSIGKIFDLMAMLFNKKLSISAVRVKKFCAHSVYSSSSPLFDKFERPYSLDEGLSRTIKFEFFGN